MSWCGSGVVVTLGDVKVRRIYHAERACAEEEEVLEKRVVEVVRLLDLDEPGDEKLANVELVFQDFPMMMI